MPGSNQTVSAASCASKVATLTYSSGSNPAPPFNAYVVVSGVSPSGYNGTYQVTATGTNTIGYQVSSCPTSGSGGSFSTAVYSAYYPNGNDQYSIDGNGLQDLHDLLPGRERAPGDDRDGCGPWVLGQSQQPRSGP